MVCLYCGGETKVANSREQKRNNQVWRRRQCLVCGSVFTTHESIELESALSVNKHGHIEPFRGDLLLQELQSALAGQKDSYAASKELMATIIKKLLALPHKPEFLPADITRATAEVLKRFDKSAYLRYLADHPNLQ